MKARKVHTSPYSLPSAKKDYLALKKYISIEQGPVSRKSRELFGPEKSFVKLRPACSVKLVFSYVVKGIKIKITAKFRASKRLRFEDTKRIMSPEIRPKSFGTFEKQAPEHSKTRQMHYHCAYLRTSLFSIHCSTITRSSTTVSVLFLHA